MAGKNGKTSCYFCLFTTTNCLFYSRAGDQSHFNQSHDIEQLNLN